MNHLRKKIGNKVIFWELVFCAIVLISSVSASEKEQIPIRVSARVDRNRITVGDTVKYTILVSTRKNIEVELPPFVDGFAPFGVKDFGYKQRGIFGRKKMIQWFLLDTYVTGKHTLPGMAIRYKKKGEQEWKETKCADIQIEVESLLGKEKEPADIKDIKGPVGFPRKSFLYCLIIFLLLAAGGIFGWFCYTRHVDEKILPPRPAHEIAYERLQELENKSFLTEGKIKEFYFELSLIVRHYLEDRFALRAPEMTTEEFLASVRDSSKLSYEHKSLLREFLFHCDLVKFAKYGPSQQEINASVQAAKRLIEETRVIEKTVEV